MTTTRTESINAIAAASSPAVGIAWELIVPMIPTLLDLFAGCLKSAETPERVLAAHYDESTGTFDQRLIDRARPHTRRAARQHGLGRLRPVELDRITAVTFREGLSHGANLGAVMASQPTLAERFTDNSMDNV